MEVMTKTSKSKHKFVLSEVTLRYHCTTWNEGDLKRLRCISPCKKYKLILHRGATVLQQKCCYTSWFTLPGFVQLRANKIQGVFHGIDMKIPVPKTWQFFMGQRIFERKKAKRIHFSISQWPRSSTITKTRWKSWLAEYSTGTKSCSTYDLFTVSLFFKQRTTTHRLTIKPTSM